MYNLVYKAYNTIKDLGLILISQSFPNLQKLDICTQLNNSEHC